MSIVIFFAILADTCEIALSIAISSQIFPLESKQDCFIYFTSFYEIQGVLFCALYFPLEIHNLFERIIPKKFEK